MDKVFKLFINVPAKRFGEAFAFIVVWLPTRATRQLIKEKRLGKKLIFGDFFRSYLVGYITCVFTEGLQVYRFTGLQVYRFTGLQVYRFKV